MDQSEFGRIRNLLDGDCEGQVMANEVAPRPANARQLTLYTNVAATPMTGRGSRPGEEEVS
jgi:hypothetical protein